MPHNFSQRHIGPRDKHIKDMLSELGFSSLDEFSKTVVPNDILVSSKTNLPEALSEKNALEKLIYFAKLNKKTKSFIGMGYYDTITPPVIQRNILENPGWYTQYTPYQAEISQGRLEALLNYQTMVSDLTGLPLSNASLLDEATAAAEAMIMFYNQTKNPLKSIFLVSKLCHSQTIDVLKTRSEPLNIELIITDINHSLFNEKVFGALLQYPDTYGFINDFSNICDSAHNHNAFVCIATDLLALTLLKSPGEMGADVAIGNSQRFGVPMGYGGPHAAFLSTTNKFQRKIPGRLIGLSQDSHKNPALRMALQTREQHIRRDKATSNICTAQVLLAIIAGMYATYHGSNGLVSIAKKINRLTNLLASSLIKAGYKINFKSYFDTIQFKALGWQEKALEMNLNFRDDENGMVGISLDETTTESDIDKILKVFNANLNIEENQINSIPNKLVRESNFLQNPVFNKYHSETEILRYIHSLETKDLSLTTSMIPLGSCTMKLNATSEMMSVTWPQFANVHPFAPSNQVKGYKKLISELGTWLINLTGFHSISLQPNSGAQGEYAGLMIIRAYHKAQKNSERNICLIPSSAHGTNPASAVMAGMKVIVIKCDNDGNIDIDDLQLKANKYEKNLAAIMITYPSTHGVFEPTVKKICKTIHDQGGQVYMDGANLNALVELCKPGQFGVDVMHINLHKTFCIPHGGGGPGMGPIVCSEKLSKFLPGHTMINSLHKDSISAVSAAPFGSSSILPISWSYIAMMGSNGLKKATQVAILNANYLAKKLEKHYPVLYRGVSGYHAHEFIIDIRPIKELSNINEEDIAKRLMDYGFHAPTMSWPVPGTMMIEPTESESKNELDKFCQAMISIKNEIDEIISGEMDPNDNPLKNAPHTAQYALSDNWNHSYSRFKACFPMPWQKDHKYWPPVGRVDNAYGDRNLICTCPEIEEYID
ncbi:MAG: aminomethyl-transferring glycine dehydrogenase [Candidatus Neomarinimicrobiota bacterium]